MKGIELFNEEAKKRNLQIGSVDISSGDKNGNFTLTNPSGKITIQNYKRIADVYGNLTFYHFTPEEAMEQIFELIDTQFELEN